MGTRGLTAVVKDGDFKIAQYGQWDHYPEGQGQTVLDFLNHADLEKFKAALDEVSWLTDEDQQAIYDEVAPDSGGWVTMEQAEEIERRMPGTSRDHGAGILSLVYDGGVRKLRDGREFASDSLFCEWAYVVDFDAGGFEIYQGFQHEPHSDGRFANLPKSDYNSTQEYYPVRLLDSFPLSELPENFVSDYNDEYEAVYFALYEDGSQTPLGRS